MNSQVFRGVGFESGAAGWDVWVLPLCYARSLLKRLFKYRRLVHSRSLEFFKCKLKNSCTCIYKSSRVYRIGATPFLSQSKRPNAQIDSSRAFSIETESRMNRREINISRKRWIDAGGKKIVCGIFGRIFPISSESGQIRSDLIGFSRNEFLDRVIAERATLLGIHSFILIKEIYSQEWVFAIPFIHKSTNLIL